MNDNDKSKDQLISELAKARQKISRLEQIITAGQMETQVAQWALESQIAKEHKIKIPQESRCPQK